MGGLNNPYLFSHSSAGLKSEIQMPTELVSGETTLPALEMALLTVSSCDLCKLRDGENSLLSLFCKDISPLRSWPYPYYLI